LSRAKEAVAAKTKAEDELRALALQLDTAVARARECEDKERSAEDVAARLKVRRCIVFVFGSEVMHQKFLIVVYHTAPSRLLQLTPAANSLMSSASAMPRGTGACPASQASAFPLC
jgi:hypothetical protein